MPIRKRKPTSAGRRFQSASDFSDITKSKPERSLIVAKGKQVERDRHGSLKRIFDRHKTVARCPVANRRHDVGNGLIRKGMAIRGHRRK